jgi:hypothetical protein
MAGKVLNIDTDVEKDSMATAIARRFHTWDTFRNDRKDEWKEVAEYVFSTDTSTTSNGSTPWRNSTVVPKLCQIRDNLHANYMATLFPKRKWFEWQGGNKESQTKEKIDKIETGIMHLIDTSSFYPVISQLLYDWIDHGDCFSSVEWCDERNFDEGNDAYQGGYVGPNPTRISPYDIVFNPIAKTFKESPKIIRVLIDMGELVDLVENKLSTDDESATAYAQLLRDLRANRSHLGNFQGELHTKDHHYSIAGFHSYQSYLQSDTVELLVFYGDIYDEEEDTLYKNHIVTVVDRVKVLSKEPNPSVFGFPQIFKAGWRERPDNLWSMGPLDNLLGLQYRLNQVENSKADLFDLTILPPLKIKGHVQDFEWGPMTRIYTGDDGDVEIMSPDVQALNANLEIREIESRMEEMAGSPKEAMGFRTPGEKTKYEVQRLENAASRIFQNKVRLFEQNVVEPLLNAMLEMARRRSETMTVRVQDPEFNAVSFSEVTPTDLVGIGRLVPVASRHFAEQAELVQNLTGFFTSPIGQDPEILQHFSSVKLSQMLEELLEIDPWQVVEPYVRLGERADGARMSQAMEQDVMAEQGVEAGITPDDTVPSPVENLPDDDDVPIPG